MSKINDYPRANSEADLARKAVEFEVYRGKRKKCPPTLNIDVLPAFLKEFTQDAAKFTDADAGMLVTALLPICATNIGNRVFIPSNGKQQTPRLYTVLVGPSSTSRKSTATRLALTTMAPYLNELRSKNKLEREQIEPIINKVTYAKLMSLLAMMPNRLYMIDEFGEFLQGVNQSFNSGMKETITSVYDGDRKTSFTMERSDYIDQPCLSILGATTAGWLYKGFEDAAERGSGFLQRFIYCLVSDQDKRFSYNPEDDHSPDISILHKYNQRYTALRSIKGRHELMMSKENKARWMAVHDRVLNEILAQKDDDLLAYATRIYTNVFLSLVIIITLMKDWQIIEQYVTENSIPTYFSQERVSKESIEEALELCAFYLANARPMISIIREGGNWEYENKILKYLEQRPDRSDKHSNIMNNLHIKAIQMKTAIQNLAEMGKLEVSLMTSPNANKPTKVYQLTDGEDGME
jgi:hypothetical protein